VRYNNRLHSKLLLGKCWLVPGYLNWSRVCGMVPLLWPRLSYLELDSGYYRHSISYEIWFASVHGNNLKQRQYAIFPMGSPRYSLWPSLESLSSMSRHFYLLAWKTMGWFLFDSFLTPCWSKWQQYFWSGYSIVKHILKSMRLESGVCVNTISGLLKENDDWTQELYVKKAFPEDLLQRLKAIMK
jgi:hypothetical protein